MPATVQPLVPVVASSAAVATGAGAARVVGGAVEAAEEAPGRVVLGELATVVDGVVGVVAAESSWAGCTPV